MRAGPCVSAHGGGRTPLNSAATRMDVGFWVVPDLVMHQQQGAAGSPASAELKVVRLMDAAFFPGRTPRSPEYRAGCRAALEFRLSGTSIPAPYAAGTAAADAFFLRALQRGIQFIVHS